MIYFICSIIVLVFVLVIAPFGLFPSKMDDYGGYLTGLAAIGAALKFVGPYLAILFYKKRYSNELIWKAFLDISDPDDNGRITELDWIAGVINYYRRCHEVLHMGNPWYNKLPSLSDEIYSEFGTTKMVGKKEAKLFEEIKNLLFDSSELVAMNSTPDRPIVKEDKYKELHELFRKLVEKSDSMNKLLVSTPVPIKKIIEGNDFYKSFFKTHSNNK